MDEATSQFAAVTKSFPAEAGTRDSQATDEYTPSRIGKFMLLGMISQGGSGRVYRARDLHTQRLVALKVPRPDRFSSEEAFGSFLREAQAAVRLEGIPNIVTVYEVDRHTDGTAFIAIKLIDGWTLSHFLGESGFERAPLAEFLGWLIQVAEALSRAHAREIRHRDLKPSNILIDQETRTSWVGDFGLAIHEQDQLSRSGEVAGTYLYMSPEQVRGETYQLDGRTDIWSLGVILYERLAGRRPFEGSNKIEVFERILNRPAIPPSQFRPHGEVPKSLESICMRCLEKKVADRYSNMESVARDLREWLLECRREHKHELSATMAATSTVESVSPQAANPASTQRKYPWPLILGAALSIVLVLAGLAAIGWGPHDDAGTNAVEIPGEGGRGRGPSMAIVDLDKKTRFGASTELLAAHPQEFRWPNPQFEPVPASENWRPNESLYSLSSSAATLMACGTTQSDQFRLSVTISQRTWTGKAGVFWGGRRFVAPTGEQGWIVQALWLKERRERADPTQNGFFLVREQFLFCLTDEGLEERHLHEYEEQKVPDPLIGNHRLQIQVQGGRIVVVTWDEAPLPLLTDDSIRAKLLNSMDDPMRPTDLQTKGVLGLISAESATDFLDAMFRR